MQNWYEPISTSRATGVQSCDLYKVLRKCKVVLENTTLVQSTTPVLIRYYSVLQVTTHPPLQRPESSHPGDAFSTKKYHISQSCYLPKCHELLRLPRKVTLQLHQILRLPRKMNLMIDPGHMWNVIYNARSKQSQPRTSPNTAPATQNESHDWSGSGHIWNVIYNARSKQSHRATSPNTAPATQNESHDWSGSHLKRHLQCAEQAKSTSNLTKYCTSPNTAPARQNECHQWSASQMKRHFQCAEQAKSPCNLTKYCACHAKWISWLIRVTCETSLTMRGASKVNLELQQILHLPRKMNVISDLRQKCNVISNVQSKQSHRPTSPNTAPARKFFGVDFQWECLKCFRQ